MVCLLYGSYSESRIWIIAFITGSLAVVLSYWCCYLYNSHAAHLETEYPDAEGTITEVATLLSLLYVLLLIPVLVLYRSLELAASESHPVETAEEELEEPPPKYEESNS